MEFVIALINGVFLTIAIIAGIGPQNLNTLGHAISRNHAYAVALTCFLADSVLIVFGVIGLRLTESSIILNIINIAGILFLSYYLWIKIRDLKTPHRLKPVWQILSLKQAVLRALALTWLNPLVFIDTLVVIGGASTHHVGWNNTAFLIGALLGDFIWLFGLAFIGMRFAKKLNQPRVWLFLDIFTICLVSYILIKMLLFFVK